MNVEKFYEESASLLGTHHEGEAFPHHRRNRWNNRKPGRGRFVGYGIIRAFGPVVHIHLHSPVKIAAVIEGYEEALEFLRNSLNGRI